MSLSECLSGAVLFVCWNLQMLHTVTVKQQPCRQIGDSLKGCRHRHCCDITGACIGYLGCGIGHHRLGRAQRLGRLPCMVPVITLEAIVDTLCVAACSV